MATALVGQTLASEVPPPVQATSRIFGMMPDGREVRQFVLEGPAGIRVAIIEYGATVTGIWIPDGAGRCVNILLGSESLEDYLAGRVPAASVIGRYANRIAGARFTLEGREYRLEANNGPNHIHGGRHGFARRLWYGRLLPDRGQGAAVELALHSFHGEGGYPGNLEVRVTYRLTRSGELRLEYAAATDRPTIINLTNHAYFNLAGEGDALGHLLWLAATHYTPADEALIPTGQIAPVAGTPLDFTRPRRIIDRIAELPPHLGGYDHNFVLGEVTAEPRLIARLIDPRSGRTLEVLTTEPGVQLYTGNHVRHRGVCLETQHYPDSPHHSHFPSTVLRPEQPFHSITVWRFATVNPER